MLISDSDSPDQEKIRLIGRVWLNVEGLSVVVHLPLLCFLSSYYLGAQRSPHYKTLWPHVPASEGQTKFLIPLKNYSLFAEDDGFCSKKHL